MHPNCSRCRLPRRDCTCIYYRPISEASAPQLLHIGGTWSPSQHSAISPSAVRSALRKPVVGGGEDA